MEVTSSSLAFFIIFSALLLITERLSIPLVVGTGLCQGLHTLIAINAMATPPAVSHFVRLDCESDFGLGVGFGVGLGVGLGVGFGSGKSVFSGSSEGIVDVLREAMNC